jgi:hypothetical protein
MPPPNPLSRECFPACETRADELEGEGEGGGGEGETRRERAPNHSLLAQELLPLGAQPQSSQATSQASQPDVPGKEEEEEEEEGAGRGREEEERDSKKGADTLPVGSQVASSDHDQDAGGYNNYTSYSAQGIRKWQVAE